MVLSVKSYQTASTGAYVAERRGYANCQVKDTSDWMFRVWGNEIG